MDGTFSKLILRGTSNALWSGSYLVYVQELSLLAHPFDPSTLEFRGEPVPLATPILYNPPRSRAGFSVAPHGSLVFHEGASADDDEMVWLNRQGVLTSVIGRVAPSYRASVSPAGDMIAYDDFDPDGRNYDIWIHDLKRYVTSKFTFDKAIEIVPVWSGDGKKVLFASNRGGRPEVFAKYANGMSTEEKVAGGKGSYYASDVTRDNRFILISEQSAPNNTWDLLLVDMQGDKIPVPLVVTRFNEWNGVLSPDAQWMAYQSDESGRNEVYLQPKS